MPTFWADVALDYDKDQAWIVGMSDDCRNTHLLDGGTEASDNGIDRAWMANVDPGLYRLTLKPWSYQTHEGEWDTGIDVINVECRAPFPPIP
jgi:hypothetical protein